MNDENSEVPVDKLLDGVRRVKEIMSDDFSEAKDWKQSDYVGRIEWLMSMVKNLQFQVEHLLETRFTHEQGGPYADADKLARHYRKMNRILEAKVESLELELEVWKRAAVLAVVPLEAMSLAGIIPTFSKEMQNGIQEGIEAVRDACKKFV